MTAPVSAGSVSTRIASSAAEYSCSGRSTRSKKRDTGRKQSLTDIVPSCDDLKLLEHRVRDATRERVAR